MSRKLHRSAGRDEDLAHNEGFVEGVAAMLRLMRECGPTGWWRYFSARMVLELPDGTKVKVADLIGEVGR